MKLSREELTDLGYWRRFRELRGVAHEENTALLSDEFDLADEEMDILRGKRPMPAPKESEKPLPELEFVAKNAAIVVRAESLLIADAVGLRFGPLLADACRMLEALRLLSEEDFAEMHAFTIRDQIQDDPDYFQAVKEHPRVVSWGKGCELAAELVKKHEGFGK